uniref:F-box domain-containing protein n=1 Tax=Panagrolaimus sp. JU765 TaxID=591449 RepID=A0AC34Q525_9BILA
MTEYFNFLGLPTVVQDLIAAEIVHNSIPEDRIQFALTCQVFNELVKHAKPKKILKSIFIGHCQKDGTISFTYSPRPQILYRIPDDIIARSKLEKRLRNAQIQILTLTPSIFSEEFKDHVDFLNVFYEATKFVTTLRIQVSRCGSLNSGYFDFYEKLNYLKCLEFEGPFKDFVKLSKIPTNLKLSIYSHHTNFSILAEKLATVQLFELHFDQLFTKKDCQELFETVRFKDGVKIRFRFRSSQNDMYAVYMKHIGQDSIEIQYFPFRPSCSNKDLGITIAIIKPDMLVETFKKLDDGQA